MDLPDLSAAEGVDEAALPDAPGCYILVVDRRAMQELELRTGNAWNALYVGKSEESIRRRVAGTHLLAERSGSSTLRRSVGALLRDRLRLSPQTRSQNVNDKKRFSHYRFDPHGEAELSRWIARSIRVLALEDMNPGALEDRCISWFCPPLNLIGWKNPDREMIKNQRKACADLAGSRGQSRGMV